jgi:hypothetical protein
MVIGEIMLIYTNSKSKQTRKQKVKQQERWEQSQRAIGGAVVKAKSVSFKPLKVQSIIPIRPGADDYKKHNSVQTNKNHTYKKETPIYTGDAMIGISTMHKSNAVPVFSTEEAKEISRMRRG